MYQLFRLVTIGLVLTSLSLVIASPPNHHTRVHQAAHDHSKERIEDAFESHARRDQSDEEQDDHELDHEAILGSRQKAQEFDGLTPEESKRRLKKLVESGIDSNHDGYVDKSELTEWVFKSFINLAIEEGQDRVDEEDADGDGLVTWDEHLKSSFDDYYDLKDNEHLKNELIEEDLVLWKYADQNKDGKMDAKEFAAFNSPEEFEHMHNVLIQQMLDRRDRNKDGLIDFNEFISDENGNVPDSKTDHYLTEKDKFINEYDLNHDQKLDHDECLNWIVPNNRDIAQNEALHLISSADGDKDGRLSVSEIVDNYDVFVGSEATDFGEQLNTHAMDEL